MALLKRKKSDAELMNLVKSGDISAFGILYERYKIRLYNFILRFIGDEALAEDIFQEAFLRLFKNREFWNPKAHFSTYLYKIARNICLDHFKKSSTSHETILAEDVSSNDGKEMAFEKIEDVKPSPSEVLEEKEKLHALENALFSLPADLREVIILSRYEGLKYEEIAEITNTSLSAVKQKARRAISILKEKLKNFL